jgi:hypothetical protein
MLTVLHLVSPFNHNAWNVLCHKFYHIDNFRKKMNFYFRSVLYDDTFVSFATKEIIFLVMIVIILANMLAAADVNKLYLPL